MISKGFEIKPREPSVTVPTYWVDVASLEMDPVLVGGYKWIAFYLDWFGSHQTDKCSSLARDSDGPSPFQRPSGTQPASLTALPSLTSPAKAELEEDLFKTSSEDHIAHYTPKQSRESWMSLLTNTAVYNTVATDGSTPVNQECSESSESKSPKSNKAKKNWKRRLSLRLSRRQTMVW